MRAVVVAALLAGLAIPLAAQEQRPQLSAGRVTGELVVGAYAGIGGFFAGRYLGETIGDFVGVESDVTRRRVGYVAGFATGALATAGAVYAIGTMGDQTGEFGTTLMGTTVGFVGAIVIGRVALGPTPDTRRGMSTAGRWAAVNALALLPAIGATVAFNSTRSTH